MDSSGSATLHLQWLDVTLVRPMFEAPPFPVPGPRVQDLPSSVVVSCEGVPPFLRSYGFVAVLGCCFKGERGGWISDSEFKAATRLR